jgi:hypothetical protein
MIQNRIFQMLEKRKAQWKKIQYSATSQILYVKNIVKLNNFVKKVYKKTLPLDG